jgi:hypothetical protein
LLQNLLNIVGYCLLYQVKLPQLPCCAKEQPFSFHNNPAVGKTAPLQAKEKGRGCKSKTAVKEDLNLSLPVCSAVDIRQIIADISPCQGHMRRVQCRLLSSLLHPPFPARGEKRVSSYQGRQAKPVK